MVGWVDTIGWPWLGHAEEVSYGGELGVISGEERATVLPALAEGAMGTAEVGEELAVGDDGRVVDDLDGLGVAADAVVGRLWLRAAGIADAGLDDTRETPEPGVRAPESAHREGRRLEGPGAESCSDIAGGAKGREPGGHG